MKYILSKLKCYEKLSDYYYLLNEKELTKINTDKCMNYLRQALDEFEKVKED